MPSHLRTACLLIGVLPLGWLALRSAPAVPATTAQPVAPAPQRTHLSNEAPRLPAREIEKRFSESMPWLQPLRKNRLRYAIDRRQLDEEAERLWSEARTRPLTPEQNDAVLAELDLRLRTARAYAADFQPGEGLQGEACMDIAELAPREADHALLAFASGSWRAIDFDEVPYDLRSRPRAGTYFVAHLSEALHTLLLFRIDPVEDSAMHARKVAALVRAEALASR